MCIRDGCEDARYCGRQTSRSGEAWHRRGLAEADAIVARLADEIANGPAAGTQNTVPYVPVPIAEVAGPVGAPAAGVAEPFLGPEPPDAGPPAGVFQWGQQTSRPVVTGDSAKRLTRSLSRARSKGRHQGDKMPPPGSAAAGVAAAGVPFPVSVEDDAAVSPPSSPMAPVSPGLGGGLAACGSGAAAEDLEIDTDNLHRGLETLS